MIYQNTIAPENICSLKCHVDEADITIQAGKVFSLAYFFQDGSREPTYRVEGDTLVFEQKSHIFNIMAALRARPNTVTITCPAPLEQFSFSVNKGNITIENLHAADFSLSALLGDVTIKNVQAGRAQCKLQLGHFMANECTLGDLLCTNQCGNSAFCDLHSEKAVVKNVNGKIKLESVSADSIETSSRLGDIICLKSCARQDFLAVLTNGNLQITECSFTRVKASSQFGKTLADYLESEALNVKNTNGDIRLAGRLKGETKITSSFGKVDLLLPELTPPYSYDLSTQFGKLTVNNETMQGRGRVTKASQSENNILIKAACGDVCVQMQSDNFFDKKGI